MDKQQAIVIGLGQFGMALARALARQGVEVVAVDRRMPQVEAAADFATEALQLDGMSEDDLARLRPAERDLCVCAIGDDDREASIVVTTLLRQMGARRVVARATDALHERILTLVGAHEVVMPERHFGERLAVRLAQKRVLDVQALGAELNLTELVAPPALQGRPLAELRLPQRFRLTVAAIRRPHGGGTQVLMPSADLELLAGDVLVVVGPPGAAEDLVGGV